MTYEEAMRNAVGDRVVTKGGIYYAHSRVDVESGTRGTIRAVDHHGFLVYVAWDGIEGEHQTSLDPVERLAE